MKLTMVAAFSLIELMVVIAIVAIISVTAMAQYQNYIVRAKIMQGMSVIDNIGEMTRAYYGEHGTFPNLKQLGLYYDPNDPTQSPMATSLSNYIANYIAQTWLVNEGPAFSCPAANYGGYISNIKSGDFITESQNGSVITVQEMLVDVKGTMQRYCQYTYAAYDPQSQGSMPLSGQFINNCDNTADDPNAGTYFTNAGNQC